MTADRGLGTHSDIDSARFSSQIGLQRGVGR